MARSPPAKVRVCMRVVRRWSLAQARLEFARCSEQCDRIECAVGLILMLEIDEDLRFLCQSGEPLYEGCNLLCGDVALAACGVQFVAATR